VAQGHRKFKAIVLTTDLEDCKWVFLYLLEKRRIKTIKL